MLKILKCTFTLTSTFFNYFHYGYLLTMPNTYDTRKQDCGLVSKIRDTKQKSNFDKKLISQLVKYGH